MFVRLTGSVANLLIKTPKELLQDPLNANMLASILVDSSEQGNWEEAIMLAGRIMSCSQSAPETCGLCCTALLGLYSASDEDDAKKWLMSTIGVLRTVMPIHVSSVSFVVPALRLLNFMVSLGLFSTRAVVDHQHVHSSTRLFEPQIEVSSRAKRSIWSTFWSIH